MAIRKIKDAKDLNDDSLIYFKSHAKATYMSDGSTVEDAIKNIETNSNNIDLSDYETKVESQNKLQEAKNYTDTKTLVFTTELIDVKSELSKKQSALISGTNIKTVNGESLLGEGDIVISGGNSSSGGTYALVEHGTNDTTFTLTPNTFHVWDEVTNLTLILGSETIGIANEYLFQFTSGTTATTLSLPSDLKWANDSAPTIEPNMIYQVSILKGLASVLEFSNAPDVVLITFYFRGSLYYAEEGMTWEQWCNSIYNSTTLKISDGMLTVNGFYPVYNSSRYGDLVYGTDLIIENENYDMEQVTEGG